jgi:hypothetical protein
MVSIIMVTPVPSGVIIEENTKKTKKAYRQFFFQKSELTSPIRLNNFMKKGSKNIKPTVNIRPKTKVINSFTEKKGIAPMAVVKG